MNIFLKFEVIIFFITFAYTIYYIFHRIYTVYFDVKKIVSPTKWYDKEKVSKILINREKLQDHYKKDNSSKIKLSDSNKQKIIEIIKKIKINSAKWYFDASKNLIVEWLSIDKFNKDLNMELAYIYEKERNYERAEYIYRDLKEVLNDDFEVTKKLWFILAMQNKIDESIKVYRDIYAKQKWDMEIVDMLCNLNYEIKRYKSSLKFVKLYLKENPRNVEKLFIKATCLEELWKYWECIKAYETILVIQPYNTDAIYKKKELKWKLNSEK